MAQKRDNSSSVDVSILSTGVKVEGKLYSEGNMRIDGKVYGDITVNGNLTLGERSEIEGDVKAQNITISGNIEGSASVSEKLIMESTAGLKGNITAKILVIEEGAKFDGSSSMTEPKVPQEKNDGEKK